MADPIKFKQRLMLAKTEAVYGVDPNPTGAANAMMVKNVVINPMEGSEETRDFDTPYLGGQAKIPTGLHAKISGEIELVGSGTAGTVPGWGPIMRALGMSEVISPGTSVVYQPVSTSMDSVAIYFSVGSTRHVVLGCRGTATIDVIAQKIPVIKFTMTGLFAVPSEEAIPAPDFTAFKASLVATTVNTPVFTVDAINMVMETYTLDLGNTVSQLLRIGREAVIIEDRAETISTKVEALPVTVFDPFTKALDPNARVAVNITHGTVAGMISAIDAPRCQVGRLSAYEDSKGSLMWPLKLAPQPVSGTGNDQFTITLT